MDDFRTFRLDEDYVNFDRLLCPLRRATVAIAFLTVGHAASLPAQATTRQPPERIRKEPPRVAVPLGPAKYVKEAGTMWTFDAPPFEYWKQTYGFTPDSTWLTHVRLASVRLPGCSASFVSARGLVLTNHHCARACVATASPADTNYNTTGFVASTIADERKCSTLYVDQLQSIEDVTPQIRGAVTAKAPDAQVAQRDSAIASVQTECQTATHLRCEVVTLYQGGMYSLYRYQRFTDVRLVMVPEEEAAFFGGDPDNFTYPRYDLDMALLRVYQNDSPMVVTDYLKWSKSGARDGDLVFVTGNPGSTGRLLTLAQMQYLRDVEYPFTLAVFDRAMTMLNALSAQSAENQRKYENLIFGIANSQKAIKGYRAGLLDSTIMARKAGFERDLRARVDADPALRPKYSTAWTEIANAEKQLTAMAAQANYYGFSFNPPFGSQLLNWAGGLVRIPAESALVDTKRLPQYRGAGLARIRQALLADQPVDTSTERLELTAFLKAVQQGLPPNDPYRAVVLGVRAPEDVAASLMSGTKLASVSARQALLDGGSAAVDTSTDPMIVLARKILPLADQAQLAQARLNDIISANVDKVGQALFAVYNTKLPPDATFSLRISDGVVKGYPYNGTIAPYKTTFYGMFAHASEFDDKAPFHLPDRWMQQRPKMDLTTPLDFVSTNDIIGGNSGSPVINRDGELVGLIFDGNIESLPNRFIFTDDAARSVSVSSRAIIEALRNVYESSRLADELEGK
ncbi:MAG TPA: S46 family peptidase [Gemmatimonadaceae bacterium]